MITVVSRVLFVCSGNICRSPIAEGVFRKKMDEQGLRDQFEVDSAATGRWHIGEAPDTRARIVLEQHGAPVPKAARQVTKRDFEYFDYILAMDQGVANTLRRRAPSEAGAAKVALILDATAGGDVPDPYFGKQVDFEIAYDLLDAAVDRWIVLLGAKLPGRAG
ncbi:MAG: low molecular weight protein-tyrosine-phosphatase [Myxococcota bacterium]